MIDYLSGKLVSMEGNELVVELPGAGIALKVTASATAMTSLKIGERCQLQTELLIREDAWQLFGFASVEERKWFRLLYSISGIGPKTALAAISVLGIAGLSTAIASEDESALTLVPGLGKKSAGRIVLELKDKVKLSGTTTKHADVVSALVNLGWSEKVARGIVLEIDKDNLETSDLLREALSRLAKP
ncbi:MAG: Holliday junction branch migration protein RuvA [Actinobacteria bacterium]|nr:Holliday junction branch migration protein RuvA [Actinomycetota bacterium]